MKIQNKLKLLILIIANLVNHAFAASNDFSKVSESKKTIPVEKLLYQLEIQGEVLVFDKNGHRLLYKLEENRNWRFGDNAPIVGNWSVKSKGLPEIAIRHEWVLSPEGKLTAQIKQYDSMERGKEDQVSFGKLIKESNITIENFATVIWPVLQTDEIRVVAKFEVIAWADKESQNIGKLPLNSNRITIYDNKGNLWASRIDNSDGNNIYFGAVTHMGSLFISYQPFSGAKEIGFADRGRIRIEDNGVRLWLESAEPFIPRGIVAKVYGKIDLNRRTERVNAVKTFGSDDEKNFINRIK